MQLRSGNTIGIVKTKSGFNLSIRCGNSFMSADLTPEELDLFAGHIVAELMNGTDNKITVYGAAFNLAEDDLDIVQPEKESAAYEATRKAIDADVVAGNTGCDASVDTLRKTLINSGDVRDIPRSDERFLSEINFLRFIVGQSSLVNLHRKDGLNVLGYNYKLTRVEQ